MSQPEFNDIAITGIDEEETLKHPADPVRTGVYNVHLKLSARPPHDWDRLFDTRWSALCSRDDTRWQNAWVSGQYIIVRCSTERVGTVREALEQVIALLNQDYRKHLEQMRDRADRERQEADAARQKARDDLKKLNQK